MADSFKALAQSAVSETSGFAETLFTCPTNTGSEFGSRAIIQVVVSSIVVCNTNASAAKTYAIRVVPSGDTSGSQHTIFSDRSLAASSTDVLSLGIALQSGDAVKVHAQSSDISMSMFGIEMA